MTADGLPAPLTSYGTAFRKWVTLLIGIYAILLILLFAAMEFIGERSWPLAVAIYLPQTIFLLPMIVLAPAALLAEVSHGTYATLLGCVIIFLCHVPIYAGFGGRPGAVKIKVITNNYGHNHGLRLEPFIDAEKPDFVGLVDSGGAGRVFKGEYPQWTVLQYGQFMLMTRAPVTGGEVLKRPMWRGMAVAARFTVKWDGEDLAIYLMHMPTPRSDFAKLAGLGLVKELAGRNKRRSDQMSFAESMRARVELAREVAAMFSHEQLPYVAMGDYNMPENGFVHRIITSGLTDCFRQAGRGFGFTFPGDTHNPLTLGQPWLRIDYVLAGPGWRAQDCRVEPDRRSQHRAVVATLSRDKEGT